MNVRASGSYTIPWVDVLAGVAFQSRPGNELAANLNVPYTAAIWEAASAGRSGMLFNGAVPTATQTVNLLDSSDLFGERTNNWDLTLRKNIRFGQRSASFGADIYNLLNSDAATNYNQTYVATPLADGTWVTDNPATPSVEVNGWGDITQLVNPRFMRFSMTVNF
jgi:hypothetical protein